MLAGGLVVLLATCTSALGAERARILVVSPSPGQSQVLTYAPTASGNAVPLSRLSGTSTGMGGSSGIVRTPGGDLMVSNATQSTVTTYAGTPSGNVAPVATLGGTDTGLSTPRGLAFDKQGDLFVANAGSGTVTEYRPGAQGDAAPIATMGLSQHQSHVPSPWGVAVDAAGKLWVTDTANGELVSLNPGTTVGGPGARIVAVNLSAPKGLAITRDGRLLIANSGSGVVTDFAPDRVTPPDLTGPNTLLDQPTGIAVDAVGHIWVTDLGGQRVSEFGPAASGNTTPIRTISGGSTTFGDATDILPVGAPGVTKGARGVSAVSATMQAIVAPGGASASVQFEWGPTQAYGATTRLQRIGSGPGPVVAGATVATKPGATYHYRAVVTNSVGTTAGPDQTFTLNSDPAPTTVYAVMSEFAAGGPAIVAYPPGAQGDVAPQYEIRGPHTQLVDPIGVALDSRGDVFVADFLAGAVLEYSSGARGDATPIARITVPGESFDPSMVALDSRGHLLVGNEGLGMFPAIERFTQTSGGNWVLEARIIDRSRATYVRGVAFGPEGENIEGDQDGRITNWGVGADGQHPPVNVISGSNTGLQLLSDIAVDNAGAVTTSDSFTKVFSRFAPTARGNVAPIATLSPPANSLGTTTVSLDAAGRIVIPHEQSHRVDEYAAGASGHAAPLASIAGPLSGMDDVDATGTFPVHLTVTTATLPAGLQGQPYPPTVLQGAGGYQPYTWSVLLKSLPPGMTLSPDGTLGGTPLHTGNFRVQLAVQDASSPTASPVVVTRTISVGAPVVPSVYVTDGVHGTLSEFPLSASGDAAPTFALGSGNGLSGPGGVVIDPSGRVYATSSDTATVQEYPPGAGAGAQPDRTISGSATGLTFPGAIALDATGGIYVANPPSQSITYYAPGAQRQPAARPDDQRYRHRDRRSRGFDGECAGRSLGGQCPGQHSHRVRARGQR